jgi:histone-lysine N-methyltransferase SETMAR
VGRKELDPDHDNAPLYSAFIVREFFAKNDIITMVDHPSYSPDLAPCDFFVP